MKVLYIIDKLGSGGKERRLVQLLKGLDQNDDISSKLVLLTGKVHYREVFDLKTEVLILKRKIRKDPLIFFKLYKLCRKWNPDIIHAWGSMPAVYAGPVARLLNIKMINASVANAPDKLDIPLAARAFFSFPFSDVIQANSYAGLKSYNVPENKANVVYNGFDFGRIDNLRDKEAISEEMKVETEYVVGMVSAFRPHKDYSSFISAALKILKSRDDVTFICVGSGPDLEKTVEMADENQRIIFAGTRNDVESIVNIFDIGVLLTDLEKHGEGISNSIMEYMALGKPVIATDGGATPEIVLEGKTGFLIPDKSPGILAEKIEYLLDNREERIQMGEAGRRRVMEEFPLDKMVKGHISLYNRLLSDG